MLSKQKSFNNSGVLMGVCLVSDSVKMNVLECQIFAKSITNLIALHIFVYLSLQKFIIYFRYIHAYYNPKNYKISAITDVLTKESIEFVLF
jgi:hypothetical protein